MKAMIPLLQLLSGRPDLSTFDANCDRYTGDDGMQCERWRVTVATTTCDFDGRASFRCEGTPLEASVMAAIAEALFPSMADQAPQLIRRLPPTSAIVEVSALFVKTQAYGAMALLSTDGWVPVDLTVDVPFEQGPEALDVTVAMRADRFGRVGTWLLEIGEGFSNSAITTGGARLLHLQRGEDGWLHVAQEWPAGWMDGDVGNTEEFVDLGLTFGAGTGGFKLVYHECITGTGADVAKLHAIRPDATVAESKRSAKKAMQDIVSPRITDVQQARRAIFSARGEWGWSAITKRFEQTTSEWSADTADGCDE